MSHKKIIGLSGSLRQRSYNTGLLRAFVAHTPPHVDMHIASIAELPLYNAELDEVFPEPAQKLKDEVEMADAVIIATPEYNRSVPGVLKNAIDWISRPSGKNSLFKKPVLVVGVSTGSISTAVAQSHLKQSLLHLNAVVPGKPEFMVGNAREKFDEEGNLIDEKTREYIEGAFETLLKLA